MSEDKRKVHTDALETLGTIIDETAKRDAIHLAVEPVVAKERLHPGDHVNAKGEKRRPYEDDAVGIVDPFLKSTSLLRDEGVRPGERFWLVLYPRQITSLRHVWEHPAFPPSEVIEQVNYNNCIRIGSQNIPQGTEEPNENVEASKKWIEDYVEVIKSWHDEWDPPCPINSYDDLMKIVEDSLLDDDYLFRFKVDSEPIPEEFWHHYEIVTRKKIDEDKKLNFFVCSC